MLAAVRWLRAAAAPIRWFRRAPQAVRIGLVVTLLVGAAASVYYVREFTRNRTRARELAAAWRLYEESTRKCDFPAMVAALDRVLELSPQDESAAGRKAAIASEAAEVGDGDLASALVNRHLQHGRLPEAAREARKALAKNPRDWRSLCALATHAINVNRDISEARRWIESLPDPHDSDTHFDAGGLLYAIRLTQFLDQDAASLRRASLTRIAPIIPSGAADLAPAIVKAQLIDCYLEPFHDDTNLAELADFWGPVSRFADSAVATAIETGDLSSLVRLGNLGEQFQSALSRLRIHRHVPDDRSPALAREVSERTRRIWMAVRKKDASRHESYLGIAALSFQEGQYRQGVETLLKGLEACGDRFELLDLLTRVAEATGNAEPVFKMALTAAERDASDPAKWCLVATAAHAVGHLDSAQSACEKARAIRPDHPWARRIQTQLYLETGELKKAMTLLREIGAREIRSEPRLVRLYARALVECDETMTVDSFASELLKHENRFQMRPTLNMAFVRGLMDARASVERTAQVVERAKRLLKYWPDDPGANRVMADALRRQSELSSPPWNPDVARAAIRAYARIPQPESGNPEVVVGVATLLLKAFNEPQAALRTVTPLREPAIAPILSAPQRETIGAVFLANGKTADAIVVLEQAVRNPRVTAGCWIQLSLAYHGCGRSTDARVALDRLGEFPDLTAGERDELQKAKRLLEPNG